MLCVGLAVLCVGLAVLCVAVLQVQSSSSPPLEPSVEDCSLGGNMASDSIPVHFGAEYSTYRGLVCGHIHRIARFEKILTFMS